MSTGEQNRARAAVVGAGPVGCLTALSLANRGFQVAIYERRPDPRENQIGSTSGSGSQGSKHEESSSRTKPIDRSINLAISARGLKALSQVEQEQGDSLAQVVLNHAVPMKARMIHTTGEGDKSKVKQMSQPYGLDGECINSVSRGLLNTLLLDEATSHPHVSIHFSCKLRHIDFDASATETSANNEDDGTSCKLSFELFEGQTNATSRRVHFVVGCDGINSIVRNSLARYVPLNFHQEYIDSAYVELRIPPTNAGDYALDRGHLHIWPRHSFMLIALANLDKSFTSTLFAPQSMLAKLTSREDILEFFQQEFPDALDLMGADELVETLLPRLGKGSGLSSIKCDPYHYKDRGVILGDAAHAMLPFYGQGLNCGFEDVSCLVALLDKEDVRGDRTNATASADHSLPHSLERVFAAYSQTRHDDLLAINYLASQNYKEMSSSVVDPMFLLRKRLDSLLMKVLPKGWWSSLYSMVTFQPDVGYSEALRTEQRQKRLLERVIWSGATVGVVGLAAVGRRWLSQRS